MDTEELIIFLSERKCVWDMMDVRRKLWKEVTGEMNDADGKSQTHFKLLSRQKKICSNFDSYLFK